MRRNTWGLGLTLVLLGCGGGYSAGTGGAGATAQGGSGGAQIGRAHV